MIGSLDPGGSQCLVMEIYRKIDTTKLQFDFVVDHPGQMYFADEIQALGGKIYPMPGFKGWNWREIKDAWQIFFTRHTEYKILHSHVRSYASLYLPIAKKMGVKTIIHSHNTSNGKGWVSMVKAILQYPLRYQADYFMACSLNAGKWLFGKAALKKSNFYIIANGIDTARYCFSQEKRDRIRKEFHITKDTFVVGFLARVVEQKNPLFVIAVFHKLLKENPSLKMKLLFAGDGELLTQVQAEARTYDIYDNVIFTGLRTDVPELMMAMDLYLLPSFWEGFGITLIEAQATALKCLCSEYIQDEPIISDLVERVPLKSGAENWAKKALTASKHYDRTDMTQQIIHSGYDINSTAAWMADFYIKIFNESIEVTV